MKMLAKSTFFIFVLVFMSCQKQNESLPIPSKSSEIEGEEANLEFSLFMDKKFKYSSKVTVKDSTGQYYANYKIYSNDEVGFNHMLNRYKNTTIKITDIKEDKIQEFLQNNLKEDHPEVSEVSNNLPNLDSVPEDENKAIHVLLLESNVDKGKGYSLQPDNNSTNKVLINLGNVYFYLTGNTSDVVVLNVSCFFADIRYDYWHVNSNSWWKLPSESGVLPIMDSKLLTQTDYYNLYEFAIYGHTNRNWLLRLKSNTTSLSATAIVIRYNRTGLGGGTNYGLNGVFPDDRVHFP